MSAYVNSLNTLIERERAQRQAQRDEEARADADAAREKFVPLDTRLARLLATIPPEVQAEGLAILDLQGRLRARGKGHYVCSISELGPALRRLGWRRVRSWSNGPEGSRTFWFPPT
jgi:hypothetical protein